MGTLSEGQWKESDTPLAKAPSTPFEKGVMKGGQDLITGAALSSTPLGQAYQTDQFSQAVLAAYKEGGSTAALKLLADRGISLIPVWNAVRSCSKAANEYYTGDQEAAGEHFVSCILDTATSAMVGVGLKRSLATPSVGTPKTILDTIIDDANRVSTVGGEILTKQANALRQNLPKVQRRSKFQTDVLRSEFIKDQAAIVAEWERQTGMYWPSNATPHHIIPLESGGANKWYNIMPTYGRLPNHSLPGIPGPHSRNGALRRSIQQGRRALPPGTVTDLNRIIQ